MIDLNEIYIIDDVIPPDHQNYLLNLYSSSNIDWQFQKDITYHASHDSFNKIDRFNPGFSNLIQSLGNFSSPLYHTVAPIIYATTDKLNINILQILKCRAFLQFPISNQSNSINNPHIDAELKHIVILYYLNDSDGETIIYNETTESNEYTIKDTVKPQKGRCVIFNGKYYHSSSKPTTNIRATININILV